MIGIKGIGKTTLINSILPKIPHIDYLIGSSVLRELVGSKFEKFDSFPEKRKKLFREEAIKYLENWQKRMQKDILVDGHTTLYNQELNLVEKIFTKSDCEFFTHFILFETKPEIVLERRKKDSTKKRIFDLDIIKQELQEERRIANQISLKYNIKIYYLFDNEKEDMKERLIEILSNEGKTK